MELKSNKRAAESHLKMVPSTLSLSEVDDSELVRLCQQGDQRAFEMLVGGGCPCTKHFSLTALHQSRPEPAG